MRRLRYFFARHAAAKMLLYAYYAKALRYAMMPLRHAAITRHALILLMRCCYERHDS